MKFPELSRDYKYYTVASVLHTVPETQEKQATTDTRDAQKTQLLHTHKQHKYTNARKHRGITNQIGKQVDAM